MTLRKRIRARLGEMRFMKDLQRRKVRPEVVSFEDAAKIGLLYDATEVRDYETVKAYVKHIRSTYKKDILAMGFVDKKILPPAQYAQYGLDFFTKKDLNFRMIPVNPIVDNFISEKFDILINLHQGKCFPLQYIAALSNAKLRVGMYDRQQLACYDMLVQLNGTQGIKAVIEETERFLKLLKSST